MTVGLNYSYREILGDVRFDENDIFRKEILNTERVRYLGWEATLALRFKNIRAEVQIPRFKYKNAKVPGLTNAQFITTIRFVGGFPLKIKETDKDDRKEIPN